MKSFIGLTLLSVFSCHVPLNSLLKEEKALSQSLIDTVNSHPDATWRAGVNDKFRDITLGEAQVYLGAYKTPVELKKNFKPKNFLTEYDLPTNFDLREEYPKCEALQEVRDQSTCGSCWAFSATEVMSDRICIQAAKKFNKVDNTRISSEDLLTCCTSCGDGCDGGWPQKAFEYYNSTGLVTGDLYDDNKFCLPYFFPPCDHHVEGKYPPCEKSQPTPECVHTCKGNKKLDFNKDKHFGDVPVEYSVRDYDHKVEDIQNEIKQNGSVSAAIDVYSDFLTYKEGVYQHVAGEYLGGHAIKIIGWGVENGTPYWLCVNSWNEDWGIKGTFKFKRGSDHCGIESEIVASNPIFPSQEQILELTLLDQ